MRRAEESVVLVALLALIAWMVKSSNESQTKTLKAVEQTTTAISVSFTTSLREVTGRLATMTELLMLGRDSPSQSESLPMNKNESESLSEPEIDLSDLPETAGWAAEEEDLLQTMTPWQSSTPLIGSELPH